MKTTKQSVCEQRAAWRQALAEGRVVRHNGGLCLTSFLTVADAVAFHVRLSLDGQDAERLCVSLDEQARTAGLPQGAFKVQGGE